MPGRATSAARKSEPDPRADQVSFSRVSGEQLLIVRLRDGRILGLPLWLYPTLLDAPPSQRRHSEIIAGGRGVRWPDIDLDLSVRGMLAGHPDVTRTARAAARSMKLAAYARALSAIIPARRAG